MFESAHFHDLRRDIVAFPCADTEAGLVGAITELERLKCAAAAAQARMTEALDTRRAARDEARRMLDPAPRPRRINPDAGLGQEVGLARRESPHEGRRKLHLARALVRDLPETLAALEAGELNERRAQIVARETSELTRTLRREVDAALRDGVGADGFDGIGDEALRDAVRREVLLRDEADDEQRRAKAREDRRVTGRRFGNGMGQLSALMPSEELAQVMEQLSRAADSRRTAGDERTRAQLMVDVLVARLGGHPLATTGDDEHSAPVAPLALKLIVPAEALLDDESTEPGYMPGAGFLSAMAIRRLVAHAAEHPGSSIQRLFAMPADGALVAMDSASPLFRSGLGEFLKLRDRRCRTPFCNAPIRHLDHVTPRAAGGPTTALNGEGLCEACNYAKETEGWHHSPPDDDFRTHVVDITTPTGHTYTSRAPRPPGHHHRN